MNIDPICAKIEEIENKISELNAQKSQLEGELNDLKAELKDEMGDLKTAKTSEFSSVAEEQDLYSVKDWQAFHEFVVREHAPYLLQRRVGQKAIKEAMDIFGEIPGVTIFTKTTMKVKRNKQAA